MKRLWLILFVTTLIFISCEDDSKNNFSIIGNWEVSHLWRNNDWQVYGKQQYQFHANGKEEAWTPAGYASGSYRFEDMVLYIGSSVYNIENDGANTMIWIRQSTSKRCCKLERM